MKDARGATKGGINNMIHKVFVSYHHDKDQDRANYLRDIYGKSDTFIDKSLNHALDDMSTGIDGVNKLNYDKNAAENIHH